MQAFGGDPHNIAIAGQSGGGGVIMSQLVLYDGKKPNYQKAIPRSNQNYAAYRIEELTVRLASLQYLGMAAHHGTETDSQRRLRQARQLHRLRRDRGRR